MLSANEIKTKGVGAIEKQLQKLDQVGISVRGKVKYMVMRVEDYEELREARLLQAYEEVMKDIEKGDYTTSIENHFDEIDNSLENV